LFAGQFEGLQSQAILSRLRKDSIVGSAPNIGKIGQSERADFEPGGFEAADIPAVRSLIGSLAERSAAREPWSAAPVHRILANPARAP
jgi:hypothetical protein